MNWTMKHIIILGQIRNHPTGNQSWITRIKSGKSQQHSILNVTSYVEALNDEEKNMRNVHS